MHNNVFFCRRGKKDVIFLALGKRSVLILGSQELRKWDCANTTKCKMSSSNVWACCMSMFHVKQI